MERKRVCTQNEKSFIYRGEIRYLSENRKKKRKRNQFQDREKRGQETASDIKENGNPGRKTAVGSALSAALSDLRSDLEPERRAVLRRM